MKNILIVLIIIFIISVLYKNYNRDTFQNTLLFKNYVNTAKCLQDDIELSDSYFKCQLNSKYSPININVNIVKYQNFSNPSSPLFSEDDIKLLGDDDYKKMMKVISYQYPSSLKLFDAITNPVIVEKASLEYNNFLYLPDIIIPYLKNLYDLNILQPFIDINKISNLSDISEQFNLYLSGYLIFSEKPSISNWKLDREICIIYSEDKKNIVTIQFNQTISYLDNKNEPIINKTTTNINTEYTYLIIYPCINTFDKNNNLNTYDKNNNVNTFDTNNDENTNNISLIDFITPIIEKINIYGDTLKKRNMITDYQINELINKLYNLEKNNIQYVLIYHKSNNISKNNNISSTNNIKTPSNGIINDTYGFSLVKRINSNIIFINYFEIPINYYKNLCDDSSNYVFKGRCYSNCPKEYIDIGLSCIKSDNVSDVISLFDPNSNYCKQICKTSDEDISVYDPIIQKACWCKSMKCDKCSEYSIKECNC
jgi:hypothetical protein